MQTFTVEIKNEDALKVLQDLQEKHFINILSNFDLDSHVFPGKPMSSEEFKSFISRRENGDFITLKQAKELWAKKKLKLQSLTIKYFTSRSQ
jgi:hypothetical protein